MNIRALRLYVGLVAAAVSTMTAASAAGQTPDFSGQWILETQTSGAKTVARALTVYSVPFGGLTVQRQLDSGKTLETYRVAGTGAPVNEARWGVGRVLLVTVSRSASMGGIRSTTEVWSFDEQGRLLISSGEPGTFMVGTIVYRKYFPVVTIIASPTATKSD
jgi:hypothetical protein